MSQHQAEIDAFMDGVRAKQAHESEFLQAVEEVAEAVIPFIADKPKYKEAKILERMVEPERTIMFRVPWLDDKGQIQINKGFRVERPVAIDGEVKIRPIMYLALSYDHRIIDGKESVGFLKAVKEMIENPSKIIFGGKEPEEVLLNL